MPSTRMDSRVEGLEKQMEEIHAEIQRSNFNHDQLRTMGRAMVDMQKDFERMKNKIDNLYALLPVLKEISKQKDSEDSEAHSTNHEDGATQDLKQAFKKVELPNFHGNGPIGWRVRTDDPQNVQRAIHLAPLIESELYVESMGFVGDRGAKNFTTNLVRSTMGGAVAERFKGGNWGRDYSWLGRTAVSGNNPVNSSPFRGLEQRSGLSTSIKPIGFIAASSSDDEGLEDVECEVAELIDPNASKELQGTTFECHMLDLPLYSLNGFSGPKTMKMKGNIGENSVIEMVDSGESHNFNFFENKARELRLPISET
ncbi:hypothetical protein SESBI_21419 [Sesbania bispinosa]|nr:hypothetical protein SESBI_21419 [Sesbania bispinosa]